MKSNDTINTPILSFIIPTFNEEEDIQDVIDSINTNVNDISYEITIVDNGSTDSTQDIVEKNSVNLYVEPTVNVSELRNIGAKHSLGSIFVFIDGDVLITQDWWLEIHKTIEMLEKNNLVITGSRCGISNKESIIEKYWFKPLLTQPSRYINSGHLIVHRELFAKLEGFNSQLVTGEDTDFSYRAISDFSASIHNNANLKVIHLGYPKDLASFVKREIWHGTSSGIAPKLSELSKVQSASILFLLLHLILLISLIVGYILITYSAFLGIIALCILSSIYKYKSFSVLTLVNASIFYIYYLGRSIATGKLYLNKRS